ncbi:uncharacterized protein C8Q71DRAFT_781370 [Rhodofomes roseus]|uniref:F-box domain-containing protein n=1 Tax=Rhodofomes roseus TaxID=34475 RepID=A0ABQ8K408_9APHY|nr:uncharacterized protein C8Q71DRAFT_781370 [Rhodofomes roseus]KAH9831578.1 hypothetical protein C8Q71DRAFT_781370 [Rhodofomes roseus]
MIASLPPELNDHILDYLHKDSRSLGACALTCRAWLATARYHRFRDIRVETDAKLTALRDLVAPSPALGLVVRRLRIYNSISPLRCSKFPSLPTLTTLVLCGCGFRLGDLAGIGVKLPALQELSMSLCGVDLDALAEFLSSISGLTIFSLAQSYLIRPLYDGVPVVGHLDSLRTLRLDFSGLPRGKRTYYGPVDWFVSTLQPQQIQTLHVIHLADPRPIPVQPLFDTFGPGSLEHLFLGLYFFSDAATIGFTLEPCVNLRTIELGHFTNQESDPRVLKWPSVLISQLDSPSLETLTLTMGTRPLSPRSNWQFKDFRALEWQSIVSTLRRPTLQNLKEFRIHGRGDKASLEAHLKEMCRDAYEQGLFRLVQQD